MHLWAFNGKYQALGKRQERTYLSNTDNERTFALISAICYNSGWKLKCYSLNLFLPIQLSSYTTQSREGRDSVWRAGTSKWFLDYSQGLSSGITAPLSLTSRIPRSRGRCRRWQVRKWLQIWPWGDTGADGGGRCVYVFFFNFSLSVTLSWATL